MAEERNEHRDALAGEPVHPLTQGHSTSAASNADVLSVLNDLLQSCRDGAYGFATSAEHAQAQDIKTLLARHAGECTVAAREIEQAIVARGGEPEKGGTAAGALHRGWVAVRAALSQQDDKTVLQECERGEDTAVARYRKALATDLPADLRPMIERQALGARRNHDEVKALRDALKNS
ncbi:MAG: PA2169 family four-helix-bundle protein [Ramlibacter sp.]